MFIWTVCYKIQKLDNFINKKNPKTISLGILKNKNLGSRNQKLEIVNPQS
jgi:hypothetical protein